MPLKDALEIGRQVAEGLEAAHEKGVVHRDIKPANIMVDAKGRATILDFGLARLTEASKLTRQDQTVGTAAYMSPEQIQGMDVDYQTDIWALGCVLYEMVAGVRPFKGQYDQALAYEICSQEPEPLTGVRAGVPMELEFIVGKCLAKEPDERYSSAGEIAKDLLRQQKLLSSGRSRVSTVARSSQAPPPNESPSEVRLSRVRERIVWALALAVLTSLLAFQWMSGTTAPSPAPPKRFSFAIDLPVQEVAISPDGMRIAYIAQDEGRFSVWVQNLGEDEPRKIVDDMPPGQRPGLAWSPDSQTLACTNGEATLIRAPAEGGPSQVVTSAPSGWLEGPHWSPDGRTIVIGSAEAGDSAIFSVPARGGRPSKLFEPGSGQRTRIRYGSPHFIEGSARPALLFDNVVSASEYRIGVRDMETGSEEMLAHGWDPVYSPTGHIIYRLRRDLWALPFSKDSLKAMGEPFLLRQDATSPSVSDDGSLVFLPRTGAASGGQLVWIDSKGNELEPIGQPQDAIRYPKLSPDETRVAVAASELGDEEIWVHEVTRPVKTRLTFSPGTDRPAIWTSSGDEIIYGSYRGDRSKGRGIFRRPADGTGEPRLIHSAGTLDAFPSDVSADGRYIVYDRHEAGGTQTDIWYLERQANGEHTAHPFLEGRFTTKAAKISPDGDWLAYVSDETGENEVYVQRFPEGGAKLRVSSAGGSQPRWSLNGASLYFVAGGGLNRVDVAYGQQLRVSKPAFLTPLFDYSPANSPHPFYDVSADETRFVVIKPDDPNGSARSTIRVVLNWYEEFRDREQD